MTVVVTHNRVRSITSKPNNGRNRCTEEDANEIFCCSSRRCKAVVITFSLDKFSHQIRKTIERLLGLVLNETLYNIISIFKTKSLWLDYNHRTTARTYN